MRQFRLTIASWQMLQRLSQPEAALVFSENDGRFHFILRGKRHDMIRPSTLDALNNAGLLRRERTTIPSYAINEKGLTALRERLSKDDFLASDEPVMSNITVLSQTIES